MGDFKLNNFKSDINRESMDSLKPYTQLLSENSGSGFFQGVGGYRGGK